MSGDFSRSTFDPRKHYSGVRMQQGRVQLDADWNEQVDIATDALRTRTRDLVGPSGGPAGTAGFALTAEVALVFGGDGGLVEAPAREEYALRAHDHVTVEAVVLPRTGGAGGPIFSAGHLLLSVEEDGRLRFQHGGVDATVTSDRQAWDRPRRAAAVYDGQTITLYLDGTPVASGKAGAGGPGDPTIEIGEIREELLVEAGDVEAVALFSAAKPRGHRGVALRIGGTQPGAPRSFDGVLRSVRLWKAALPAAEVKALASRPFDGDPLLLAGFPLDEGSGRHARDRSALRHDAHLTGPEGHSPRWRCDDLRIGAGRYYVGGSLCENEAAVAFEGQPDLPGEARPEAPGLYLAVLDVRERVVGALEDRALIEIALGGMDTSVRTKTVWQVRLLRLPEGTRDRGEGALAALAAPGGSMRARCELGANTQLSRNSLYRVEIHDEGDVAGAPFPDHGAYPQVTPVPGDPAAVQASASDVDPVRWRAGRWVELSGTAGTGSRVLTQITGVRADGKTCRIALAKPVGLRAGPLRMRLVAGYKWSRNNGLDALPIQTLQAVPAAPAAPAAPAKPAIPGTPVKPAIPATAAKPAVAAEPATTAVVLAAPVGHHGATVQAHDWIEILGNREMYRGDPGPLARIQEISPDRYTLTLLDPVPEGAGQGANALVRRWDRRAGAPDQALSPASIDWTELEDGIQVQFTGSGPYRAGQFWLMPARVKLRDIDWPDDPQGTGPAACEPEGGHRFARLALVRIDPFGVQIEDLRSTFVPLADLRVPGAELTGPITIRGALHVMGPAVIDDDARAHRLSGELEADVVHTPQLADRAVTASKLAPRSIHPDHLTEGLGFVPDGFAILGTSPVPPPGFVYAHRQIEVNNPEPEWKAQPALPDGGGRAVLVTVGEALYALPDHDRAIYRHDEAGARWVRAGERSEHHRRGFGAAAVGREIHIVGGLDQHGLARADHEVFDTAARGPAKLAPGKMASARARLGVAAVGDLVFAVGGVESWLPWRMRDFFIGLGLPRSWFHPRGISSAVEVYDRRRARWHTLPSMPTARCDLGIAVLNDRLHVVGGRSGGILGTAAVLRDHEVFTPARRVWDARMPLATPRAALGAAVVDGILYATGGLGPDGPLATVEAYRPLGETWHAAPALPAPRHDHGSSGLFGDVFVAFGHRSKEALGSAASCAMASTLFVHRKVTPGAKEAHRPKSAALREPDAAHAEHARHAVLEAPALAPGELLKRGLVLAAVGVLLVALIYGYSPGEPSPAPAHGATVPSAAAPSASVAPSATAAPSASVVPAADVDAAVDAGQAVP
jgi:hypothetical protein